MPTLLLLGRNERHGTEFAKATPHAVERAHGVVRVLLRVVLLFRRHGKTASDMARRRRTTAPTDGNIDIADIAASPLSIVCSNFRMITPGVSFANTVTLRYTCALIRRI